MSRPSRRRFHRADDNSQELINELRRLPGVTVASTSKVGGGFPDIVVGYKDNNYLFEIKDPSKPPSKQRLNDDEVEWHRTWLGQVATVLTAKDVKKHIGFGERSR